MKKYVSIWLVVIMLIFSLSACQKQAEVKTEAQQQEMAQPQKGKIKAVVTILPQLEWVRAVGGNLVEVAALLPPGASPEVYQVNPKEMVSLEEADVYFPISVPVEVESIIPNAHTKALMVNLAEAAAKIYPDVFFGEEHEHDKDHADEHEHDKDHADKHEHDKDHADEHEHDKDHADEHEHDKDHADEHDHEHHHHSGRDPHIWLSPKRVEVMVQTIAETFSKIDSENAKVYTENAKKYIAQLQKLSHDLEHVFEGIQNKSFIIMHPSMGYFAEDFDLEQISIEKEGKQATADHMKHVIDYAKEHGIKVIFYQKEFDNNQAKTIAMEIGGEVMELEPLAENYLANLEKIGQVFAKVLAE